MMTIKYFVPFSKILILIPYNKMDEPTHRLEKLYQQYRMKNVGFHKSQIWDNFYNSAILEP